MPPEVQPARSLDNAARAIPITINQCFGWLHPAHGVRNDVAVLLCGGLTRDALDSHHAMRLLAETLAAAGYCTMRFDYPGTGDSIDAPSSEHSSEREHLAALEHWTDWERSVHAAGDWLRNTTGARRLVLCGLRIGATLATVAAHTRDDVAGLILLAPVVRGHSYMRQLGIEARLQTGVRGEPTGGLDFQELHLSAETVRRISEQDLRHAQPAPGCKIAIFAQAPSTPLENCVQAWTAHGCAVTCTGFTGLEPLLRHDLERDRDLPDFADVVAWLQGSIPTAPLAEPIPIRAAQAVLLAPGYLETPMLFGPDQRLFGMLCRPDATANDLATIICNTGRDPHYGFARFGVELARHLARCGVASLRMDFAGLGDSIDSEADGPSQLFGTNRTADIGAAIDTLWEQGYRRFAVHGLCAGAYHGLHAAVADSRIGTLLLVNLPVFTWQAGETPGTAHRRALPTRSYLKKLASRAVWRRLAGGRLDIAGIIDAQTARLRARATRVCHRLAQAVGWRPQSPAQRMLAALSRRGVRTLFLLAPGETGVDSVEQEFGPGGIKLQGSGAVLEVVDGFDHLLSQPAMRRRATDLMTAFLPIHQPTQAQPALECALLDPIVR
jgi:alpha/beta superfamily hydrolase